MDGCRAKKQISHPKRRVRNDNNFLGASEKLLPIDDHVTVYSLSIHCHFEPAFSGEKSAFALIAVL